MEWKIWVTWRILFYIRYSRLFQVCHEKKHETVTGNKPIRIYVNKIKDRVAFKIKTGCYVELLTPEAIKLLESTKSKITEIKNGENVPRLGITEVVLIHCSIVNSDYQQNSRV